MYLACLCEMLISVVWIYKKCVMGKTQVQNGSSILFVTVILLYFYNVVSIPQPFDSCVSFFHSQQSTKEFFKAITI